MALQYRVRVETNESGKERFIVESRHRLFFIKYWRSEIIRIGDKHMCLADYPTLEYANEYIKDEIEKNKPYKIDKVIKTKYIYYE